MTVKGERRSGLGRHEEREEGKGDTFMVDWPYPIILSLCNGYGMKQAPSLVSLRLLILQKSLQNLLVRLSILAVKWT